MLKTGEVWVGPYGTRYVVTSRGKLRTPTGALEHWTEEGLRSCGYRLESGSAVAGVEALAPDGEPAPSDG